MSIFFGTLVWMTISLVATGEKTYNVIKFRNLACNINPRYGELHTCKIKVVGRDKNVMNIFVNMSKPLINIKLKVKAYKFYSIFRPFIGDINLNLCDVFEGRKFHPINQIIMQALNYTNFKPKCPIPEGAYYFKNFSVPIDLIPSILPDGRYRLDLKFVEVFKSEVLIGNGTLVVDVGEIKKGNK